MNPKKGKRKPKLTVFKYCNYAPLLRTYDVAAVGAWVEKNKQANPSIKQAELDALIESKKIEAGLYESEESLAGFQREVQKRASQYILDKKKSSLKGKPRPVGRRFNAGLAGGGAFDHSKKARFAIPTGADVPGSRSRSPAGSKTVNAKITPLRSSPAGDQKRIGKNFGSAKATPKSSPTPTGVNKHKHNITGSTESTKSFGISPRLLAEQSSNSSSPTRTHRTSGKGSSRSSKHSGSPTVKFTITAKTNRTKTHSRPSTASTSSDDSVKLKSPHKTGKSKANSRSSSGSSVKSTDGSGGNLTRTSGKRKDTTHGRKSDSTLTKISPENKIPKFSHSEERDRHSSELEKKSSRSRSTSPSRRSTAGRDDHEAKTEKEKERVEKELLWHVEKIRGLKRVEKFVKELEEDLLDQISKLDIKVALPCNCKNLNRASGFQHNETCEFYKKPHAYAERLKKTLENIH